MTDGGVVHLPITGLDVEVAGSGPPVVFTHDGLLHGAQWDAQFDALASDYRVARWDRRGYGRSPATTEPYSSFDDLATVIRAVSATPVTLIGCSFGGFVSLQCALDHPDLVSALILIGPIVSGVTLSEHFLTRGGRAVPGPDAPVEEHIAFWTEDPWIISPANTAARQRLRTLLTDNPHNLDPKADSAATPDQPAVHRLAEIRVPTLILVGAGDHPDVHAHCGAIEAGIPDAQRVLIPGSGHLPQLEAPDTITDAVRDFLRSPMG